MTLIPSKVRAQYDVYFAHYFDMQTSFNPAAAGKADKLNIAAAYAMNMTGFENAPQTAYISADMPFKALNERHGVGLKFMNDKIGLFTHQQLEAMYDYQTKFLGGRVAIGIQAGLLSEAFKGSEVDVIDTNDPVFTSKSDVNGNSLDLAIGLYYKHDQWYAGVSAQHLTGQTVSLGERNEIKIDPTIYLTGGYDIKLRNPLLSVAASALVRSDLTTYRADVTARLIYTNDTKTMSVGLGYSPTNSATIYLAGSFHGIMLGYTYEIYTNGISIENGSHELFVGYQTDINITPKGRNRHQSVRYL